MIIPLRHCLHGRTRSGLVTVLMVFWLILATGSIANAQSTANAQSPASNQSAVTTQSTNNTVSTVQEDQFRSRWADYQVDRPQDASAAQQTDASNEDQGGLLSAFGRSFNAHFRNGPLQLRADLSAGWEYTDEQAFRVEDPKGTDNSPFLGPALGVFYNQELGPVTISARYSVGYVYYLDQSYLVANHNGGIFSQTAGLDLALEGKRTKWDSTATFSQGTGEDIESGVLRDRVAVAESLGGTYTVTDFTQVGASGSVNYASYTGGAGALNLTSAAGGNVDDTSTTTITGLLFGDYIITGKTRLRLEFGAGDETQNAVESANSDLSYYQALLRINYIPSPKLTLDGGVGWGVQDDSAAVADQPGTSSHPVYTITISYASTEKTSAALHFGYEGVDLQPDFSLQAHWQPRQNTSFGLSVYQNSGYSTFIAGESLVTRGVLASLDQRFFEKVDVVLGGGGEQSDQYQGLDSGQHSGFAAPYYFGSVSFLWQINSAVALQAYFRGYTGEAGLAVTGHGLQSTASVSLRLTF